MKKISIGLLLVLCFILVLSTFKSPVTYTDLQQPEQSQQPEVIMQATIPSNNTDSEQNNIYPPEQLPNEPLTDGVSYKPGIYKAGTDIPAGLYMAINNGSAVSRVAVINNRENNTTTPKILVTSRYIEENGNFTERDNYTEAVRKGGGTPVLPDDDIEFTAMLRDGAVEYAAVLAHRYDGLLLSGGGDIAAHFFNQEHHPAANQPDETLDTAELALCRAFVKAGKPILGICRGMQIINVAMGGELIQDIPALLDIPMNIHYSQTARHDIIIRSGTWLYSLFGAGMETNSLHHQCIDGTAPGFTVVAYNGPVVEAMERGNLLGVQFHPERMLDEGMIRFFDEFIYRCSYEKISIDYFSSHVIIEIQESQYIEIDGAYLINIEQTVEIINEMFDTQGFYSDGMYLTDLHIPESRYKLKPGNDSSFSSFLVYDNITHDSLIYSGVISDTGEDIILKKGQFIKLIYASMSPA